MYYTNRDVCCTQNTTEMSKSLVIILMLIYIKQKNRIDKMETSIIAIKARQKQNDTNGS